MSLVRLTWYWWFSSVFAFLSNVLFPLHFWRIIWLGIIFLVDRVCIYSLSVMHMTTLPSSDLWRFYWMICSKCNELSLLCDLMLFSCWISGFSCSCTCSIISPVLIKNIFSLNAVRPYLFKYLGSFFDYYLMIGFRVFSVFFTLWNFHNANTWHKFIL